jgi:hypothetical protein
VVAENKAYNQEKDQQKSGSDGAFPGRRQPSREPQCGAVAFVQRFGDALNLEKRS